MKRKPPWQKPRPTPRPIPRCILRRSAASWTARRVASSADPTLALVAGESSGDLLAGRLLGGLRERLPHARMHGIGGPRMAEHGFQADWPMEKLAVRGLFEVLAHYREIKGIRDS